MMKRNLVIMFCLALILVGCSSNNDAASSEDNIVEQSQKVLELAGGPKGITFDMEEGDLIAIMGNPDFSEGPIISYRPEDMRYKRDVIIEDIFYEFAYGKGLSGVTYILTYEGEDPERSIGLYENFLSQFTKEYGEPVRDPLKWIAEHDVEVELDASLTNDVPIAVFVKGDYDIQLIQDSYYIYLLHEKTMDRRDMYEDLY